MRIYLVKTAHGGLKASEAGIPPLEFLVEIGDAMRCSCSFVVLWVLSFEGSTSHGEFVGMNNTSWFLKDAET